MKIDITPILADETKRIPLSFNEQLEDITFLGSVFRFLSPLSIEGSAIHNGRGIKIELSVNGDMQTLCSRCGEKIIVPLSFELDECFLKRESLTEDDDAYSFEGTQIDLHDAVIDAFTLNVEGQYLCKVDCKGLCPNCGANLNKTQCTCNNEIIDPRWEKLRDMIKNND